MILIGIFLEILEKRPFFRADMAGLGIYHMGAYGRIGVYTSQTGENVYMYVLK